MCASDNVLNIWISTPVFKYVSWYDKIIELFLIDLKQTWTRWPITSTSYFIPATKTVKGEHSGRLPHPLLIHQTVESIVLVIWESVFTGTCEVSAQCMVCSNNNVSGARPHPSSQRPVTQCSFEYLDLVQESAQWMTWSAPPRAERFVVFLIHSNIQMHS